MKNIFSRKIFTPKGMTIIEMMIAIAIFEMGLVVFTLLLLNSYKLNSFILEEGDASFVASRGTSTLVKETREARQSDAGDYPLLSGDSFNLTFFSDVDGDGLTERIHYFLDFSTKQLKKGVTKPTGNPAVYASGDNSVSVVANYIINSSSQPVFFYYNKNYPGDTAHNPLPIPVNPVDVRIVKILLRVNITPNQAPDDINIEAFSELRNTNDYE